MCLQEQLTDFQATREHTCQYKDKVLMHLTDARTMTVEQTQCCCKMIKTIAADIMVWKPLLRRGSLFKLESLIINAITSLRSQCKTQINEPLIPLLIETMEQCSRTWPSSTEISELKSWLGRTHLLAAAQKRISTAMSILETATEELSGQEGVLNLEHLLTAKPVLEHMEGSEVGGKVQDQWKESMQALIEFVMKKWPQQADKLDMLLLYCKLFPKSGQKVRSPFLFCVSPLFGTWCIHTPRRSTPILVQVVCGKQPMGSFLSARNKHSTSFGRSESVVLGCVQTKGLKVDDRT